MDAALLLLAAGASARMRGRDKLLEVAYGHPVLRLLAARGLAAGLPVRVTVPDLIHPRARLLADMPVELCVVDDAAEGMAASLRRGIEDLLAAECLILPGDMPEITEDDLRLIAETPGSIVQATAQDGTPGHPVKFSRAYYSDLAKLTGDVGARSVLRAHATEVTRVALPRQHATTDLDTPEAWTAWRALSADR